MCGARRKPPSSPSSQEPLTGHRFFRKEPIEMSENLPIPSPVDPTPGPPGNTCEPGGHRTTFAVPLTVRFVEADRAGIAFFGRAFEYAHAALEELLLAAGCPIRETFDRRGWGLPIVHAEADYRRPLVLGDRLVVEVGVHRVVSSSISL